MVWSHDDFIRELSRQLVELETLRQKLRDATGGRDPIRTHRGVGYAFDPER